MWPCSYPIAALERAGREARPPVQRCPSCRAELRVQGGYPRALRHAGRRYRLWIWRGYCRACDVSHALLPDVIVAHHLDSVDTIHHAVTGGATPDVAASTRRGWRARFRRNQRILESACMATTIALGGDVTDFDYPHVLAALWAAVRHRSEMTPPVWRIVNIISGMSWIRERVNSSWAIVGVYPRPP